MVFVACWLLLVGWYVMVVLCCIGRVLLAIVFFLSFADSRLLFVVLGLLVVAGCSLRAVCWLWFVVRCVLRVGCCVLSACCCVLSVVW